MLSQIRLAVVVSALAFALGVNAWAADVQGTYSGTIKCDVDDADGRTKVKDDIVILVNQDGDDLRIDFDFFALLLGIKYDDPNNSDKKARGGAVLCGGNSDPTDENVVTTFEFKKANKDKAKLKGTANFTESDAVGVCKYNATRSSTAQPDVDLCL